MNTNDLYIKYARVIEMCKGTALQDKPWQCLKSPSGQSLVAHPFFDAMPFDKYKFAVAILEDKPVFVGDTLWRKGGHCIKVAKGVSVDPSLMSWQPPAPKRTFELNGVELPCPVQSSLNEITLYMSAGANGTRLQNHVFAFSSRLDLEQVLNAIAKLLQEVTEQ